MYPTWCCPLQIQFILNMKLIDLLYLAFLSQQKHCCVHTHHCTFKLWPAVSLSTSGILINCILMMPWWGWPGSWTLHGCCCVQKRNKKTKQQIISHCAGPLQKTKSDVIPPLWMLNGSFVIVVQGTTSQWSFTKSLDNRWTTGEFGWDELDKRPTLKSSPGNSFFCLCLWLQQIGT